MSESDASGVVSSLRAAFAGDRTRPLSWRGGQLDALKRLRIENEGPTPAAWNLTVGRRLL
jgi:hypothetical protein